MVIYVARVPCGCAVDACKEDDDVRLWLYGVLGNGWQVERHDADTPIDTECAACRKRLEDTTPLTQQRMF
jgi:hypothetical protein